MAGSTGRRAPAGGRAHVPAGAEGRAAAAPVRPRARRHVPADGRPRDRSPGARGGRRLARPRRGNVPAERLAPAQDHHIAPLGPAVAAASGNPGALPRRAAAVPAPVPELPDGRGGDRDRLPQAPRRRGRACGVEAGRDPLEDVPAPLLRRAAPNLDQGALGGVYTVAKEMGHGGESLVRRVYGHLGQVRHRADAVEYRVEQHAAKLGERLAALNLGTTIDTTGVDSQPYRVSRSAVTPRA